MSDVEVKLSYTREEPDLLFIYEAARGTKSLGLTEPDKVDGRVGDQRSNLKNNI